MSSPRETTPAPAAMTLRIADTPEELDAVEPLWNALQAHHSRITPKLGSAAAKREPEEAWRMRRSKYERWLRDPATFFAIAEDAGTPIGYAFVTIGPGYASWGTGERLAELETLSVAPDRRGGGVGAALIEAVWDRLERAGVDDMAITTTQTNVDARRFYERHGFEPSFVVFYGRRERR